MVSIPAGSFWMGCVTGERGCSRDEKPRHQVSLGEFWISKYEVTQKQWEALMGDNPSYFSSCSTCPVEMVSWNEAKEFISKLNSLTGKSYRLPTEAEWEYAARGGENNFYSGSKNIEAIAWCGDNSKLKSHPVGQKRANAFGLYDMSGNVWEWCEDWYGNYTNRSQRNPKGPSTGIGHLIRGGAFSSLPKDCRVSLRNYSEPWGRAADLGFRLAS